MLGRLEDLIAIGAIAESAATAIRSRATRLLELASGQVCAYLSTTEALLIPALTAEQLTALAAIVAECAGSRLNRSLAPSTDAWTGTGCESAMLNRWQKQQIDELIGRPGRGSVSVLVERGSDSSGLTYEPRVPWWLRTQSGSECFDQIP